MSTVNLGRVGEIRRNLLANIVMLCDAIVIIWFICHIWLLNRWIDNEKALNEKETVNMTDFACRIKRLPKVETADELNELVAALACHIERIVSE